MITIERAYALAAAGKCRTIEQLKRELRREGCEAVEENLAGFLTRQTLRKLMRAAGV